MKLPFFSRLLKTLSLAGVGCALAELTTFAQDATTTVGWWPEGSNPRVVAERIGGSIREMSVRRAGRTDTAFTINWETTSTGTATPGSDYQAGGGILAFAAAETEKVVQIPILDDGLLEFPETIDLRLFNASGGVAISNPMASVVIPDNEIPTTLDLPKLNPFMPPLPDNLTAVSRDGGMFAFVQNSSGRLLRFGADGTLLSFSRPIHLHPNIFQAQALLATPDDKAILLGEFTEVNGIARPRIVRLLLDGTVDESFKPPQDLAANRFQVLTVQRDGGILVATTRSDNGDNVIRLLPDGSRDTGFGPIMLTGIITNFAVLNSGGLLVELSAGNVSWLVRLLSNGVVDPSFQPTFHGCEVGDCWSSSILVPDGSVVVGGLVEAGTSWRWRKMKPDGSLDENFRVPSWVFPLGPALPDGRLFAEIAYRSGPGFGGIRFSFFVILRPDGSIDESHPGFLVGGNGDADGRSISALSETVGFVYGAVGSVNGRQDGASRVPLRGPFKKLIYASSGLVERPFPGETPNSDARAVLEFIRSGETTSPARVRYRTRDGTAKSGQHYLATSGELTFAPLESRKTVEIALLPRSEFTETFELILENAIGAEVAESSVTISILGTKQRFPPNPVQFANGNAMISVLPLSSFSLPGEEEPDWAVALESSEDLKAWTPVTNTVTRFNYTLAREVTIDVGAATQSKRFYRLRKL